MPRVCLDPGHGGSDPGATGPTGLKEKDVVLEVAQLVTKHLKRHKVEVVLTRDADVDVSLTRRAAISNSYEADALVSIHCNASDNRQAYGTEVWTTRGQTRGDILATEIATAFMKDIPKLTFRADWSDKDIDKEANFAVLVYTKAPATLVELAFITNPNEEKLLASAAFREQCAIAIAKGTLAFLGIPWQEPKEDGKAMFKDIEGHWAKAEIEAVAAKGLLTGYPDGNFHPDEPVTRAQLAVVVARLLRYLDK